VPVARQEILQILRRNGRMRVLHAGDQRSRAQLQELETQLSRARQIEIEHHFVPAKHNDR